MSIVATVVLAACGEGGGGGGGNPAPPPQAQTIAFAQSGPLYKFAGDAAYSNAAAGGGGSGAVTYASNAPNVATVEAATGSVTIVGVGSAQITATKLADANFLAASASYGLRVAPRTVEITGWVGPSDAELTFASQAASLDFTRSSDLDCNPLNHTTCADGAQSTLGATTFTDTVANMQRPAMYWLKHGPNVTRGIVAPETKFQRIIARGAVVFKDRLWVTSGEGFAPKELWSSVDGRNWRLETAELPGRRESRLVALQDTLWLIGGFLMRPDVWSTTDGANWTEETATAAFGSRFAHKVIADSQKMWLIGGADGNQTFHNDVWSSSDGRTWTEATASAEFRPPGNPGAVAWQGKLWLIDGDVWSSTTGAQWSKNSLAAVIPRKSPSAAVGFKNRLWVLGEERKLWSSADGFDWVRIRRRRPSTSGKFGKARTGATGPSCSTTCRSRQTDLRRSSSSKASCGRSAASKAIRMRWSSGRRRMPSPGRA